MPSRNVPYNKGDVVTQIAQFNQGRDPERLALKYKALRKNAFSLCDGFLTSYAKALQGGKARSAGRKTAEGLIKDLLDAAGRRKRPALLDSRTQCQDGMRKLRVDAEKALPADRTQRARLEQFMMEFASRQDDPKFFTRRASWRSCNPSSRRWEGSWHGDSCAAAAGKVRPVPTN